MEALRRIDVLTADNEHLREQNLRLEAQIAAIYRGGDRAFHNPFVEESGFPPATLPQRPHGVTDRKHCRQVE